jgi:hypothetical protein
MDVIMRTGSLIALAFAAALGTTTSAGASPVVITGLFNTGVDVSGGQDQAWSIVGGVNSLGYTGPAYTVPNSSAPPPDYNGAWITNPASNWDTPTPGATGDLDHSTNGTYVYQTTFNAAGVVGLSGIFAADNVVSAILLNGTPIYIGPAQTGPNDPSQYNVWTGFSGTTQNGGNTLTFDVVNYAYAPANPSGLNVVFTPLPSTWTMLIAGFLGFGFVAYRGSKKNALATA